MPSSTGEAAADLAAAPLIGHLPAFRRRGLSLLDRCAGIPGAAVSLRIGRPALAAAWRLLAAHPSGMRVAQGSKVLLSPYVVQRDPELWPGPTDFPFGAGPRSCVGQGLARLEAAITLTETAARFELAPAGRGKLSVRAA